MIIPFTPNPTGSVVFGVTLDGLSYTVVVRWNLFAQRYYVHLYNTEEFLIVCIPLIGSAVGIINQSITYKNGIVTILTRVPNGFNINDTVDVTISGATPAIYNGKHRCLVTGKSNMIYMLKDIIQDATIPGTSSIDVSLVAGYFNSTLVYRAANAQFEVTP